MMNGGWPTRSYGSVSRVRRGFGAFTVEDSDGASLKHWLCDLAPSFSMKAMRPLVRSGLVEMCSTIKFGMPYSVLYVPPFKTWAYCKNFRR
jgi:hypothetical protein